MPTNGHNVFYIKKDESVAAIEASAEPEKYYVKNGLGELILVEGADDYAWLAEEESKKMVEEETAPSQFDYEYVADPTVGLSVSSAVVPLDTTEATVSG